MANRLQDLVQYAKANPQSQVATDLRIAIQGGAMDSRAAAEGYDLSWAGRPSLEEMQSKLPSTATPSIPRGKTPRLQEIAQEEIQDTADTVVSEVEGGGAAEMIAEAGTLPLKAAAAGVRTAGRAIAEPIAAAVEAIPDNQVTENIGRGAADVAQRLSGALEQAKSYLPPEIAQALTDAAEVALAAVGGKPAASAAKGAAQGAAAQAGKAVQTAKSALETRAAAADTAIASKGVSANSQFALDLTMPKMNKAMKEDAIKKGSAGYTAPGLLSKGKPVPNPRDVKVAEAVQDVIDPKADIQTNIDRINQAVSQTNLGVREMLAVRKQPFFEAELKSRLRATKSDNDLLFAGDKASEATYDAVINEFTTFVKNKDTLGLFEARQTFDQYIQRKMPTAFKKDKLGQYLDPRDSIRANAILDVRRAANDFIADLLPANNPYKTALKRESDMLDALSRIAANNVDSIGNSRIQVLVKQHPALKWLLGGIGIGVAGSAGSAGVSEIGH